MYSKEYFDGDYRCGHEANYFDDETLSRLVDESLLRRIKKYQPGGDFLEIGCAGGAFLNAARHEGYRVHGVEFSEDAAQFARTRFKLDVFTGDVAGAHFPAETYDVVFMGDVLEHLPDPAGALKEIHRIMRNGGLLVLLCPMQTNTLFSRLGFLVYGALGKKAVVHLPPYHLFEYRPNSMTSLICRCGFNVVRAIESAIRPSQISQRSSFLERTSKKIFQYPNYILTQTFGRFGDRIEFYAAKGKAH